MAKSTEVIARKQDYLEEQHKEHKAIGLHIGATEYMVSMQNIVRIIKKVPYIRIPMQEEYILGMVALQEYSFCVVDMYALLQEKESIGREKSIVISLYKGIYIGLTVDAPTQIYTYTNQEIGAFEAKHDSTNNLIVSGVILKEDAIVPILSIEKILGIVKHSVKK